MHDLLFNDGFLNDSLQALEEKLEAEVGAAPAEHVLAADEDEWAAALAERWSVQAPVLHSDQMWQDAPQEVQIDVSHDQMRAVFDRSQPAWYPGYRVTVHIPFEGDAGVFKLRASTYGLNPPRAEVREAEIVEVIEYPHDAPLNIAATARALASAVEKYLGYAQADIEQHNARLQQTARNAIAGRRQRVERHQQHVEDTGLPVGPPSEQGKAFISDAIVRRPAPVLPSLSEQAAIPLEPVLADDVYEHILSVIRSACADMERAPGAYASMDEEARRQVLLLALNGHYRGRAVAEAFNHQGKTDLLVRHESQNLFVGECKIWKGQKAFIDTVDQLFRYRAWRDTKLAIVMFVKERSVSDIVTKGAQALTEHPQFVRPEDSDHETELRAVVSWPGDDRRLAELNVFFVSTPA